jgi:hypothetical protein
VSRRRTLLQLLRDAAEAGAMRVPRQLGKHLLRVHVRVLAGAAVFLQAAGEGCKGGLAWRRRRLPQLGRHQAVEDSKVARKAAADRCNLINVKARGDTAR